MTLEDRITQSLEDPETFSRRVARAFFKALKRAGCSDSQIISVATDVIGCLVESLEKFRQKKSHEKIPVSGKKR